MTQKQRFLISKTISTATMTDGAVLVDSATGECFELNRGGARIWQCLVTGEDLDRVVDGIAADHSVERSVVAADATKLIDELTRRGILVAA